MRRPNPAWRRAVPIAAIAVAGCAALGSADAPPAPMKAPALRGSEWINSGRLTPDSLAGRVVLVEFWAFQCVNCRRTAPAMKRLHAMFRDSGVVVIGVHTPELPAEHGRKAVEQAVAEQGLTYPVLVDDRAVNWEAFENRYWPELYVIDRKGMIRDVHIGELHEGTLEWKEMVALIGQLRRERA